MREAEDSMFIGSLASYCRKSGKLCSVKTWCDFVSLKLHHWCWSESCSLFTRGPLPPRSSPPPPIFHFGVRSDLLLLLGPITPSAICHYRLFTPCQSLWKCSKSPLVFFFFFNSVPSEINFVVDIIVTINSEASMQWKYPNPFLLLFIINCAAICVFHHHLHLQTTKLQFHSNNTTHYIQHWTKKCNDWKVFKASCEDVSETKPISFTLMPYLSCFSWNYFVGGFFMLLSVEINEAWILTVDCWRKSKEKQRRKTFLHTETRACIYVCLLVRDRLLISTKVDVF